MSQIIQCPNCSRRLRVSGQITAKTLLCPHCLADVDNPQPRFQIGGPDIDTDVKRDLSAGSIALPVLISLCILGVIIALFAIHLKNDSVVIIGGLLMMNSFALLDVLVSLVLIRGLVRWSISGARTPSFGRVLGITFLSVGTIVAVVIFFWFTCLGLVILNS